MKPFPPSCLLLCCSSYIISLPWIAPVHPFPAHSSTYPSQLEHFSLSLSLSLHMAEEEEASCIKLFGAVIVKRDREAKEEEEAPQQALPGAGAGAGAVEAAEAAARGAAALPCPRCKSRETKFCYFNNYNVNQPRHFCKACHRYWTAGGALRNVPVGAGRRRGRPSHRVGVGGGGGGVLEYPSAGCLGGAVAERWLLRPEAPARVDRGINGGLR